jgi:hypothetical protein
MREPEIEEPEVRGQEPTLDDVVRVSPGGKHAWYNTSHGLVRKPYPPKARGETRGESSVVRNMSTKEKQKILEAIKILDDVEASTPQSQPQPNQQQGGEDQGVQVLSLLSQIRDLLTKLAGEEEGEEGEPEAKPEGGEMGAEEIGPETIGAAPEPEGA